MRRKGLFKFGAAAKGNRTFPPSFSLSTTYRRASTLKTETTRRSSTLDTEETGSTPNLDSVPFNPKDSEQELNDRFLDNIEFSETDNANVTLDDPSNPETPSNSPS